MNILQEFVNQELDLANGCTEPAAVAYAVARASEFSEGKLKKIIVKMDGYVYKNGMRTGIPGTKMYGGNKLAAALGYFIKNSGDKKLTLLNGLNESILKKAGDILELVELKVIKGQKDLLIKATIIGDNIVESVIEDDHTNLVEISVNGDSIYKKIDQNEENTVEFNLKNEIKKLNINELIDLVEKQFDSSIENYLKQGYTINKKLAVTGLDKEGCGIGRSYKKTAKGDFIRNTAAEIAAGIDARMGGAKLPALTSSGSGDQGIFITLGTYISGQEYNKSESKVLKATLIAHLIAYFIKTKMGKLSSLCGLFTAAAPGLLAALLYLHDKDDMIEEGINNLYSDSGGILCDGAKTSCAFKAISAFELALRHFQFIDSGLECPLPTGYINSDLKKTLEHQYDLVHPEGISVNDTLIKTIKDNFSKKGADS
ncbi:MAG: L-serine ammonia-lyase, iron-sulfur-dependent, subunit alpha [Halanaerobiales bacterium]|nr:L-serine ammonia-lyase, iron-sulfur-dependent, subunit alpha [Halanaerobiales bacterium]